MEKGDATPKGQSTRKLSWHTTERMCSRSFSSLSGETEQPATNFTSISQRSRAALCASSQPFQMVISWFLFQRRRITSDSEQLLDLTIAHSHPPTHLMKPSRHWSQEGLWLHRLFLAPKAKALGRFPLVTCQKLQPACSPSALAWKRSSAMFCGFEVCPYSHSPCVGSSPGKWGDSLAWQIYERSSAVCVWGQLQQWKAARLFEEDYSLPIIFRCTSVCYFLLILKIWMWQVVFLFSFLSF